MVSQDNQVRVYSFIGQRIRERRKLLKLSQTELAELMGFSYQQMQKYETGSSHVSAGKLLLFAKILNVPPDYFYEGFKIDGPTGGTTNADVIHKDRARPFRIMLVEDNPADVLLFRKALGERADEVDVQVVHDAEAVVDFLQNHEIKFGKNLPDLVILDLSLPKLGGLDLLRTIKKNPKLLDLPIIVLTNSINKKDMVASYRYGAAGFVQKSVNFDEYVNSIDTIVKYWAKVVALP